MSTKPMLPGLPEALGKEFDRNLTNIASNLRDLADLVDGYRGRTDTVGLPDAPGRPTAAWIAAGVVNAITTGVSNLPVDGLIRTAGQFDTHVTALRQEQE